MNTNNPTNEYTTEDLTASVMNEAAVSETVAETEYDLDSRATAPQALAIMGKGMFGIFVVIGVIILCVYALNGSFKKKNKKQDDDK